MSMEGEKCCKYYIGYWNESRYLFIFFPLIMVQVFGKKVERTWLSQFSFRFCVFNAFIRGHEILVDLRYMTWNVALGVDGFDGFHDSHHLRMTWNDGPSSLLRKKRIARTLVIVWDLQCDSYAARQTCVRWTHSCGHSHLFHGDFDRCSWHDDLIVCVYDCTGMKQENRLLDCHAVAMS